MQNAESRYHAAFLMVKIYIIFKATHASSYAMSDRAANDVFEPKYDAIPFGI